jgi:hypothetical protein
VLLACHVSTQKYTAQLDGTVVTMLLPKVYVDVIAHYTEHLMDQTRPRQARYWDPKQCQRCPFVVDVRKLVLRNSQSNPRQSTAAPIALTKRQSVGKPPTVSDPKLTDFEAKSSR